MTNCETRCNRQIALTPIYIGPYANILQYFSSWLLLSDVPSEGRSRRFKSRREYQIYDENRHRVGAFFLYVFGWINHLLDGCQFQALMATADRGSQRPA